MRAVQGLVVAVWSLILMSSSIEAASVSLDFSAVVTLVNSQFRPSQTFDITEGITLGETIIHGSIVYDLNQVGIYDHDVTSSVGLFSSDKFKISLPFGEISLMAKSNDILVRADFT